MSIKNKIVLVVDDDEDILKIVNKILSNAGFTVLTANSPEEGRQILKTLPPHLIISDLNMEPEDGFTFIEKLRSDKQFQQTPILVLSAVNEFSAVKRVIGLGVNDYILKPIQSAMLLRKIRKALFNKEFTTWKCEEGSEPELSVSIDAEIIELGETGYRVSGPFKINPGHELKIKVKEFEAASLNKYVSQASSLMKSYLAGGNFSNDVTFIGIDEKGSSEIRKLIMRISR